MYIYERDSFLFIVWFGTKVMLSSQNEMGSFSSSHFRKSLCTITVDASLNIWWNSPVKPSDIGVFFVGKFCFLFGVYIYVTFFLKNEFYWDTNHYHKTHHLVVVSMLWEDWKFSFFHRYRAVLVALVVCVLQEVNPLHPSYWIYWCSCMLLFF